MEHKRARRITSILVIGNEGAGKTNLIRRLTDEDFLEEYSPTEYINSIKFQTKIGKKDVHLVFLDTDGVRKYENYSLNYYEGKAAIVVVYDITNQESLQLLRPLTERIKQQRDFIEDEKNYRQNDTSDLIEPIVVLVGNKNDLKRQINQKDAMDYAKKNGMNYIETSAKTGENVKKLFDMITANNVDSSDDQDSCGTPLQASKPTNVADLPKSSCCSIA